MRLLLINDIIVFIRLVLSEVLGSVNPRHELYMYAYVECDLLMMWMFMIILIGNEVDVDNDIEMRWCIEMR